MKTRKQKTTFTIKNIGRVESSSISAGDRPIHTLSVLINCSYPVSWSDREQHESVWIKLFPLFIGGIPCDVDDILCLNTKRVELTEKGKVLLELAKLLDSFYRNSSRIDFRNSCIQKFFNAFTEDYESYMTRESFRHSRNAFLEIVRSECLYEAEKLVTESKKEKEQAA